MKLKTTLIFILVILIVTTEIYATNWLNIKFLSLPYFIYIISILILDIAILSFFIKKPDENKSFFQLWKEGMMKATPQQLMQVEINGYMGTIVGLFIALFYFIFNGMWYLILIIVFALVITVAQLIQKLQVLKTLKQYSDTSQIKIEDFMGK